MSASIGFVQGGPDGSPPSGVRHYRVNPEELFNRFYDSSVHYLPRAEACIGNLCESYGLRGKKVLSLGAGCGHEEYFLSRNGCRMTLLDIDETGGLEPALKAMVPNAGPDALHYYVGDPGRERFTRERFDVVYASGLTPDELRREKILENFYDPAKNKALLPAMASMQDVREVFTPKWNAYFWLKIGPFHPAVMRHCENYLSEEPGSLFIVQSYWRGVNCFEHTGYLDACREFLRPYGLVLSEAYAHDVAPHVMLYVISRGEKVSARTPIRNFHGRRDGDRNILKLCG